MKEISHDWKGLSNIKDLFVIVGDLYDVATYNKTNMYNASSIMILPSDARGVDECDVYVIASIINTLFKKNSPENPTRVPIVCEIEHSENERFVSQYATTFSRKYAPEMICNMVTYRFNNRVWMDFSTVTSDVSVVGMVAPDDMIGYSFQIIFNFLMQYNIKCIGVLIYDGQRYSLSTSHDHILAKGEKLFAIVDQADVKTVNNTIFNLSTSTFSRSSSVVNDITPPPPGYGSAGSKRRGATQQTTKHDSVAKPLPINAHQCMFESQRSAETESDSVDSEQGPFCSQAHGAKEETVSTCK